VLNADQNTASELMSRVRELNCTSSNYRRTYLFTESMWSQMICVLFSLQYVSVLWVT